MVQPIGLGTAVVKRLSRAVKNSSRRADLSVQFLEDRHFGAALGGNEGVQLTREALADSSFSARYPRGFWDLGLGSRGPNVSP